MKLTQKMEKKLEGRKELNALRQLMPPPSLIDFFSNDYLGFAKCKEIYDHSQEIMKNDNSLYNGATGSRLLSGNHTLFTQAEAVIAKFHDSEAALLFNSGYDANLGLLSSIALRGDIILYDEFCHASIRDGISMGAAKAFKFKHNDIAHLAQLLKKHRSTTGETEIFIVTESVFSMDGDIPNVKDMADLANKYNCRLIVDEAHATGVLGKNGEGLVYQLGLQDKVFARIVTFGKALGAHGAAILGSKELKEFLVNFSRSFIYTTGLPPHSVATIMAVYKKLPENENFKLLHDNIKYFRQELEKNGLAAAFVESSTAIQCCVIAGNERVKLAAANLEAEGFAVKPILSPTVPAGKERLRFCIHSYNSRKEIKEVLKLLATFIK